MIYVLLGFVVLWVVSKIISYVQVKKMTKEKLIERCKKLIDLGKCARVQSLLLKHPKLLLMYFNELQETLTEYAQSVEDSKN